MRLELSRRYLSGGDSGARCRGGERLAARIDTERSLNRGSGFRIVIGPSRFGFHNA
jgi:hypothetical protein